MNLPARLALAFAAWFAAASATATVVFIVAWILAGPHAGILPQPLEIAVWVTGYAVIFIAPLAVAVFVYRKLSVPRVHATLKQGSEQ